MGTVEIRLSFWLFYFWMKAVTMATSNLITDRYNPHFGLNDLIFILSLAEVFHTLPHHENEIA